LRRGGAHPLISNVNRVGQERTKSRKGETNPLDWGNEGITF